MIAVQERKTLNVREAALMLGISAGKVYDAVRAGEIPHLRFGSRIVIPKAALERMLSNPQPGREA